MLVFFHNYWRVKIKDNEKNFNVSMLAFKILKIFILLNILLSSTYCSTLLTKKNKVKEVEFDYEIISKNYFLPGNEKPFPLTVQKGNNLHNTTSKDGKFLF